MAEAPLGAGTHGSLSKMLDSGLKFLSYQLCVSMPGIVETYDADANEANVKPALLRRFKGQSTPSEYPVLQRVPVIQPQTAAGRINLPVAKGDTVLLVFADRSLDNWLNGSGIAKEPLDIRTHALSDPVCIPGLYPTSQGLSLTAPEAASIQVADGTKIYIGDSSIELLDLLDRMMTIFSDVAGLFTTYALHVHDDPVSGITGVPSDASDWTTALTTLQAIQEDIQTLKT